MPELPEVESVRRMLAPAMSGATITQVLLRRANLRQPFPKTFRTELEGRRVESVERRGKYLLVALDSGATLLMHLGMSGSFRLDGATVPRPSAFDHDHVVFHLSNGVTVTFNDPRRFGVMDIARAGAAEAHALLARMGPEPLSSTFTAVSLARALAGKRVSLKVALLDQHLVAGLGNIYASEALHLAGLSPRRRAQTLATPTGRPRPSTERLVKAIKAVLRRAIARREAPYGAGRFRVYERAGEACPTPGCRGTIRRIVQAGRSTFYCPACQR
jgi:formamidopyrimidine-DNA glycosylase